MFTICNLWIDALSPLGSEGAYYWGSGGVLITAPYFVVTKCKPLKTETRFLYNTDGTFDFVMMLCLFTGCCLQGSIFFTISYTF